MLTAVAVAVGPAMSVTVAVVVAVQELASVMVISYVPAATFNKSCVVVPSLHKNVNTAVPPVMVSAIEPFDAPHVDDVGVALMVGPGMSLTVALAAAVHPLASVMVMV